jgi:hypothetical protein
VTDLYLKLGFVSQLLQLHLPQAGGFDPPQSAAI